MTALKEINPSKKTRKVKQFSTVRKVLEVHTKCHGSWCGGTVVSLAMTLCWSLWTQVGGILHTKNTV